MTFQPVIIIGAPRTGTNMLRDALVKVDGFGTWPCDEINFVWKHGNLDHEGDDLQPSHIRPETRSFVAKQFQRTARAKGYRYVVEKTCANSLRVPFVDELVPNAKYVFLTRDGHDAVASTLKRWHSPKSSPTYLLQKFRFVAPSDRIPVLFDSLGKRLAGLRKGSDKAWDTWGPVFPELIAAVQVGRPLAEVCSIQWAYCVKRSLDAFKIMDRSRWLPVNYENFVLYPERELSRVLSFLDADSSGEIVAQAVDGVHPSSIGNYSKVLSEADVNFVDRLILDLGLLQEAPKKSDPVHRIAGSSSGL